MAKAAAAKPSLPAAAPRLLGGWDLGKQTLAELRRHWGLYAGIVALVEIPTNLAQTYLGITTGTDTEAYLALAGVFMEVALIYAISRYRRGDRTVSLRTAYYSGSHASLRFILVVALLAVMLLPFVLGSDIFGVSLSSTTPISAGELTILGAVGLILALPSVWLLGRSLLAIIAVVDQEIRPVAAIRLAWGLTRRRFWRVIARALALLGWLVALLALPVVILGGLYALTHNLVFVLLLQLAVVLLSLPFTMVYGFTLYDELQGLPLQGKT